MKIPTWESGSAEASVHPRLRYSYYTQHSSSSSPYALFGAENTNNDPRDNGMISDIMLSSTLILSKISLLLTMKMSALIPNCHYIPVAAIPPIIPPEASASPPCRLAVTPSLAWGSPRPRRASMRPLCCPPLPLSACGIIRANLPI